MFSNPSINLLTHPFVFFTFHLPLMGIEVYKKQTSRFPVSSFESGQFWSYCCLCFALVSATLKLCLIVKIGQLYFSECFLNIVSERGLNLKRAQHSLHGSLKGSDEFHVGLGFCQYSTSYYIDLSYYIHLLEQ